MIRTHIQKNKGVAMLTAVVVTGILILIAMGIANVAFKQLLLSNYEKDSNQAFYNADSGIECALYWDLKNTTGTSAFATSAPSTIACSGQNISTGSQTDIPPVSPPVSSQSRVGGGGTANPTSIFQLNLTKGCVIVAVQKGWNGAVTTNIRAYGYNTCTSAAFRRIERGVTITY